ncbi:hypothetical protein DWX77_01520 [Blautia obeum]|nr:hypothetical protein DWX77_01520 [Blautia obeum]
MLHKKNPKHINTQDGDPRYNYVNNYKIRRYICQRMANGIRRDLNFLFKSEVKVEKERNLWYPYSSGYVIHLRIFDVRKLWTIGDKTAWM